MLGWFLGGAAALYAAGVARAWFSGNGRNAEFGGQLAASAYPSPDEADAELDALAAAHPAHCALEEYGRSAEGRALRLLRIGPREGVAVRGRYLVTGHLHAIEYVGGYVARSVARTLLEGVECDAAIAELLSDSQVVVAPLLNPDGAERVWRRGGWTTLGGGRFTAQGVDPNRNFPFVELPSARTPAARTWNSARSRAGTAYYRGPYPLSEAECLALAQLCARDRFAAAINFHSFGGLVYQPALIDEFATSPGGPGEHNERALHIFKGAFQSKQDLLAYRPVVEVPKTIAGQLDAFLLGAFGTASVTVEVGRPGFAVLHPSRVGNFFWLSNPVDPARWARNDTPAAIHALTALREVTGGNPGAAPQPELAAAVPS
jgi:hypothetical protein